MPFTVDDSALLASLDLLLPRIATGIDTGLREAAIVAQDIMQTSPAHGDQSGAAHAGSFAVVLGPGAQAAADAAYSIAEELLTGFEGHDGKPEAISVPTLPPDQRGILLGRPVDYALNLENEGKAVVGPTLQEVKDFMTNRAAEGSRAVLG